MLLLREVTRPEESTESCELSSPETDFGVAGAMNPVDHFCGGEHRFIGALRSKVTQRSRGVTSHEKTRGGGWDKVESHAIEDVSLYVFPPDRGMSELRVNARLDEQHVNNLLCQTRHACVAEAKVKHEGLCPNKLNTNLWVDAQSTCERECNVDEDCADFEKCCTNVCGLNSCVSARFSDGTSAQPDGQEACVRGATLTVVACRFYLAGPHTSPVPQDTTANPTPTSSQEDPLPPALYSNPHHQSTYVGGTVSFHCDVIGVPKPDVTWEKQSERRERLVMRPDQMYGNVVITNIGQLVIYNAQVWDTGIYTCIARNSAGVLRADFPLSVVRRAEDDFLDDPEMPMGRPFSPADCLAEADLRVCSSERHVDWYYDSKQGSCMAFSNGGCDDSRNRFETYEECKASCQRERTGICSLPAVQGPCKSWEARWAWNPVMKQCQAFGYGGCHGNANSFRDKKECEANCPQAKRKPCKTCRVKGKMVPSLCRSDFAIVGRLTELVEDLDSGLARFSLDEVLRDEKMGLSFFNTKHLEVTIAKIDWSCPCPNITMEENPLLVMGVVQDGMAIIQSDSYVRAVTERRLKRLREVLGKKTCGSS
ncbi:WAP, Kazal, immunoglobulin, Kunitz and NTR domain-containing protein-like [Limanda limanda]|uniref:WAP, Kazal, immunoglobulin, Kunitz and NTR domain-containing protein-like n=1 Tax=Limanda limanda TaxID=27771 RepID=UPI0029C7AE69|nr:WAP, Kazal, immunoglobulin, Kunitz and NTR domain-containing protein-like [Limanda limanda]